MPQMNPSNWFCLFIFFSLAFLSISIKTHFLYFMTISNFYMKPTTMKNFSLKL